MRKSLYLQVNSGKFVENYDGEPVNSDIIFRPLEKDTQRRSIQDVVSDYTLKYFSSVLNEESFQEISKDIGKPDNDLLAPPVLNDIIKKADQVITNKGLLHGDGLHFLVCLLIEDTDLNRFFPRSTQVYFRIQ